jgi:alpha-mannosidase
MDQLQLGLVPVTHGYIQTGVIQQHWEDLFLPVRGIWLRQATSLSPEPIDITLQGAGLVFSALKPATTGRSLVLRCYNSRDEGTAGAWQFGAPVRAAHRARADERPLHEIRLGDGGHFIPFHAAPHEIVTVMVTLASTD